MINHVVIHELVKKQHENISPSHIRINVLDKDDEAVKKLVNDVLGVYGKKNNTAHFGVFKDGEGRGNFPNKFISYHSVESSDDLFLDLSRDAMNSLYSAASNSSASSGGYILFVDYVLGGGRYFLVAMVKQKPGITLSKDLTPKELEGLDLNKLNQAARINFRRLCEYNNADDGAKAELTYLSFVSPQTNKSASGYFITAIGCSHGTASSSATRTLMTQGPKFFRSDDSIAKSESGFKASLESYLSEKVESGSSVKLSEIESLFRRSIPVMDEEKAESLSGKFIAYLNDEERGVPPEFPVHSATLNRLTSIKYKSTNWRIQFDRSALGDNEDAEIFYDDTTRRLVISNIDDGLAEVIMEEIGSRP